MPTAPIGPVQAAPLAAPGAVPAASGPPQAPPPASLYEKLRGHSLGPITGLVVLGAGLAIYRQRRRRRMLSR